MTADASAVVIVLRGEPIGKGRPRARMVTPRAGVPFVSMYTPAETRAYEGALSLVARAAMRGKPPLAGPLCVTVTASFPVPTSWSQRQRTAAYAGTVLPTKKPDPDNILKIIDALNTIVWGDDSQIVDARVVKVYAVEPSLRIEVRPFALPLEAVA